MADVRLLIAGREYIVTCKDGEEPRLQTLGNMVDEMAREAGGSSGGLNESRLLLFSALLLADKLHDSKGNAASNALQSPPADDPAFDQALAALEKLAVRLETLADRLEE
ncbi:MAG: cell division protein ZapA [Sphingorhabdus sp.]|jgi:cell division protein ZapA|uniref:cell division protein ZapA n=1 Tax=Sphingorhabdus sp. TaxID=1902408 RepID=UPI0038FC4A77